MKIGRAAVAIATGSAILVAACGAGTTAAPEPVRPNRTQANPIPSVQDPRDVTAVARRPCELLTPQQATGFGLDVPPKVFDASLGDLGCKWTSTTRDQRIVRTVYITTFTNNPTLEVAYSKSQDRPFFELTDIAGYPAIVTRTNADLPSCDIDLKVAERQSVTVIYDSKEFKNDPQQSCEVAKEVAAAVVMNVPLKS